MGAKIGVVVVALEARAQNVVISGNVNGNITIGGGSASAMIVGDGQAKVEERKVEAFTAIEVSGACDVFAEGGVATTKASVEVDGNLLPHLVTRVEDGVLKVSFGATVSMKRKAVLRASTPKVEAFTLSGSGDVRVKGVASEAFRLRISGAGTTRVNATGTLDASVSGAGSITYKGSPTVTSRVSGVGRVRGE